MKARDAFRMAGMAAALLAVFDTAHAVEPEVPAALNLAASTVNIGIGYANDDAPRFGQYSGMTEQGGYGLLDFNLVDRNDATGAWRWLSGRNLGPDSGQLRFEHSKQGNWGYYIDYSQITRNEPYTVTTAVTGIGDLTIPATPTAGAPVELKTRREAIGVGVDKFLWGNWGMQVRFRNEEKEGARLFARGTTGAGPAGSFGVFEFAPEPINSSTRQFEATLRYTGSQLQLSGGYYGTMYNNNNEYKGLNFTGGLAGLSTFTPIALPPDNQSHQIHLAGGYGFTPTTRGNFKLARTKATQEDAFVTGVPLAPGIGDNLMGRVDTTLVQAGVTSRPMPKLTLLADLRYEDRDDKTPVLRYNTLATGTSTFNGDNEPRSILTKTGKVEASYALPASFRITGGIGYDEKKRNASPVRVVSHRDTTEEISYRVELRRTMSETVTGALSYVHSDRDGSPFLETTLNDGTPGSNLIAPIHLADRKRDKVRLSVNWTPIEALNLQFFVDQAKDSYSGRDGSGLGPREGEARNYSIDAAYTFTEGWQATAWYSRNDTRAEQATCENAPAAGGACPANAADPIWGATLRNLSDSFGLGMRGKPAGKVEIGTDLSYSNIKDEYRLETIAGGPVTSLPNVSTKLTRLQLFGRYALQKNSGVRLDYILDRYKTDDWTWSTWMYADGTQVTQDPNQQVSFIGVSYYYRFQ